MFKKILATALLTLVANVSVADIASDYQTALNKYIHRDTVDQTETLQMIDQLKETAEGKDLYKILILGAQASWWKGAHETNIDKKKNYFHVGMDYALGARDVNAKFSDSYNWYAFNLAELSLVDGSTMPSLIKFRVPKLEANYEKAMKTKTVDHLSGFKSEGYGALRNLGQMNVKLYALPGRLDKGLEMVKYAYDHDKTHPRNFLTYAKMLVADFQIRQTAASLVTAKAVLNEFIVLPVPHFALIYQGQVLEDQQVATAILQSLP